MNNKFPHLKLAKSSDSTNSFFKALVYGFSGMGKTTSAKGFGDYSGLPRDKTLLLITERGVKALEGEDFNMLRLSSWEEADYVRECITKNNTKEMLGFSMEGIEYIFFDSLTGLSDMKKEHILSVLRPELTKERTRGRSAKPEKIYEDSLTIEDYGAYLSSMQTFVRNMNMLNYNTIFTALASSRDGRIVPNLSGKFAEDVAHHFDYVFLMEDRVFSNKDGDQVTKRGWKTNGDNLTLCKDTTGNLKEFIAPDWGIVSKNT